MVGWWLSFTKLWFSLHQQVVSVPSKVEALVHQEGNKNCFLGNFWGCVSGQLLGPFNESQYLEAFVSKQGLEGLFTDYWFSEHQQGALVVY